MKIIITGFSGFVAEYFLEYLDTVEKNCIVLGLSRTTPSFDFNKFSNLNIEFNAIDLLDKTAVENIINHFQPEYLLHLASVSSVAQSWKTPYDSFVNNTNIFLNIIEQIRIQNIKCRILSVGSSEEYGEVDEALLPLTEEHLTKPASPYAVARISQEMISKIYAEGYNMDIILTRSFNHIGPRQKENFVISSFAKQLVELSKNHNAEKKITTGNLNIVRDFLDVRDVVKAYYILLKKGKSGEVYNICSGKGTMLVDIVKKMSAILNIEVQMELNPSLVRPNENKKIIGSYAKIKNAYGWEPVISLEKSLEGIIGYWEQK